MQPNPFVNSALLQDESLLNISLVLGQGWPAGPSFLHAVNTLVETIVLHEHVYFHFITLIEGVSTRRALQAKYAVLLQSSCFLGKVQLNSFRRRSTLEHRFQATGREYKFVEFLQDAVDD
jgi:hypothetical protein